MILLVLSIFTQHTFKKWLIFALFDKQKYTHKNIDNFGHTVFTHQE